MRRLLAPRPHPCRPITRRRPRFETLEDRTVPTAGQFVESLYEDFLERAPSQDEEAGWVQQIQAGATPAQITPAFTGSAEHIDLVTRDAYQNLLGRTPADSEVAGWRAAIQSGVTDLQQEIAFLASDEYFAQQGSTPGGWLDAVYNDVLNRAPDDAGRNSFLAFDLNSTGGRVQVASAIVFSTESSHIEVNEAYQLLLHRDADQGGLDSWTAALNSSHSVSAIEAAIASSQEYINVNAGGDLSTTPSTTPEASQLITLEIPPLDINLLGLQVKTEGTITVTVSAQPGEGKLLGNLLTTVSNLINLEGVNNALNTVLDSVVGLVNSVDLTVDGILPGDFDNANPAYAAVTPVLDLFVAPVHLDLLGAVVDTSPIHLTITAYAGPGLVLGNVITSLANSFNDVTTLDLDAINAALTQIITDLNEQIPGIAPSPTVPSTPPLGVDEILRLTVAPIDLNLLGLNLKTSQIQVNASAIPEDGKLLGNVLSALLNTLGATPDKLATLNDNLNTILAKVVGVLNASNLVLPPGAVEGLSDVLQQLALPDLIAPTGTTASAPILDLSIASADGTTPPVDVDLLGLKITTSNIEAQLLAQTGEGQILGNLLYNVANLLNPGGSLNLLAILNALSL